MNPVEEDRALDGESGFAFDDGRRGRAAMDPTTRHLTLIACGIGLLLTVLIGGWMLSGRHSGSIPVVEAPSGPVRVKPIDPGGMQAMGAQAPPAVSAQGAETLASQPEAARPEALQAEVDAARRAGDGNPAPAAMPPTGSSPVDKPVPEVQPPPVPVPHASPAMSPDSGLLRTDAGAQPGAQPGLHRRGGHLAVQLAALNSHDAAQLEWSRLRHGHPTLFLGRSAEVERADHDGRLIYRLRTRGFASVADATAFCVQAHSQRVACTLANF